MGERQLLVFAPKEKNPDDVDEFLIFQSDNTTEVECSCEIDYTGNGIVCVS